MSSSSSIQALIFSRALVAAKGLGVTATDIQDIPPELRPQVIQQVKEAPDVPASQVREVLLEAWAEKLEEQKKAHDSLCSGTTESWTSGQRPVSGTAGAQLLAGTWTDLKKASASATDSAKLKSGVDYIDVADSAVVRDSHRIGGIHYGLPLDGSKELVAKGPHGTAYLVGGGQKIENLEVNVRPIHHKRRGDGLEFRLKVLPRFGDQIEKCLAQQADCTLIKDKTILHASPHEDGRVVITEKSSAFSQAMHVGPCLSLNVKDKFQIEYFPEEIAYQSMRGAVIVQVFGASAEERRVNSQAAFQLLKLEESVGRAPSTEEQKLHQSMRLLWQADPQKVNELEAKADLNLAMVETALDEAKVPKRFLDEARYAEVCPGHITVITPSQGESYRKAGVKAIIHQVSRTHNVAEILASGMLLSTNERLAMRKLIRGFSSDDDIKSGGADFVATRLVTEEMGNPWVGLEKGGVLKLNTELLDRTDWFSYHMDSFGNTFEDAEVGEASPAVKEICMRSLDMESVYQHWLSTINDSREHSRGAGRFEKRLTGKPLIEKINSENGSIDRATELPNETMFRSSIPIEFIDSVIVGQKSVRATIIDELRSRGIDEINGQELEDFIVVRAKLYADE